MDARLEQLTEPLERRRGLTDSPARTSILMLVLSRGASDGVWMVKECCEVVISSAWLLS
jgi:hypothetical protein